MPEKWLPLLQLGTSSRDTYVDTLGTATCDETLNLVNLATAGKRPQTVKTKQVIALILVSRLNIGGAWALMLSSRESLKCGNRLEGELRNSVLWKKNEKKRNETKNVKA